MGITLSSVSSSNLSGAYMLNHCCNLKGLNISVATETFLRGIIYCIHVISFKRVSGRLSFHFREVYQKCRTKRKILLSGEGDFMAHFRELPEDQGGITCMEL